MRWCHLWQCGVWRTAAFTLHRAAPPPRWVMRQGTWNNVKVMRPVNSDVFCCDDCLELQVHTTFIFICIHNLLCNLLLRVDYFTSTKHFKAPINFVVGLSVEYDRTPRGCWCFCEPDNAKPASNRTQAGGYQTTSADVQIRGVRRWGHTVVS